MALSVFSDSSWVFTSLGKNTTVDDDTVSDRSRRAETKHKRQIVRNLLNITGCADQNQQGKAEAKHEPQIQQDLFIKNNAEYDAALDQSSQHATEDATEPFQLQKQLLERETVASHATGTTETQVCWFTNNPLECDCALR
ncbi:hypothetical protein Pmani_001184 [Petrolisthes manimaculis]|uniref:Uncharacterized protein n=1 Tax=Petrolisthes manimaculis TaxID=1843537 RepID=A0AAE1QL32_9EUCA|nr:hypothetical protein Pmani_001184 [Petrolisthes manimaculis]